jgi:hypothetical protein
VKTNCTLLIEQVRAHPTEKTLALMAVDALIEEERLTSRRALRLVARVRVAERTADEILHALQAIDATRALSYKIDKVTRKAIGVSDVFHLHYVIVSGSRPPTHEPSSMFTDGEWVYGALVTVGARWVLATRAKINQDDESRPTNCVFPTTRAKE